MLEKIKSFVLDTADVYFGKRVTRGAAALAYYLTMTIFPLLICLYSMLGSQYRQAMQILGVVQNFIAEDTFTTLEDFLAYVASSNSTAMLIAALLVLITSASAAFRSFEMTVGDIQGQMRFRGVGGFIISLLFSVVFLAAVYLSILIMLTGSWFLSFVDKWLPFVNISKSWTWVRFLILFGVVFLMIYFFYYVTGPKNRPYQVTKGALTATAAMVVVSIVFSVFISASAKYPLVYGSIASIILLMLWLYLASYVLIMGEVINIVLRDRKEKAFLNNAFPENNSADD